MLSRTINRNKKSITLDLRDTGGREAALRVVRRCDAMVENFRPRTLERRGLCPDALAVTNPELMLTRISAFGQTGPLRERPGFAAIAQAVGRIA